MASTEKDEECDKSWPELLPSKKLFEHLRESCSGGPVNMCTKGSNFFVWNRLSDSFCDGEILTLNLNRLIACPEYNYYQVILVYKL